MSLIINNDTNIEQSFDDKYNLDINECIINIRMYCRNNNLPFFNNFKINEFMDVLKKNINFSKIEIYNNDISDSDDEYINDDIDDEKYDENNYDDMCYG